MFLGKKENKKFFEKFFLFRNSYFSKLIKDTEPVLFREEQHRYWLLFGPSKLPSSSLTPSFFCQKTSFFSKKILGSFLLDVAITYRVHDFENFDENFVQGTISPLLKGHIPLDGSVSLFKYLPTELKRI